MQFISAPISRRVMEWSLKSLTIMIRETYHFWNSIWLITERNASWFLSSGLNLGEGWGVWLGGFEDSREELRFSSSWSWKIRIEFVSSRWFCFSIWFFNSLNLVWVDLLLVLILWLLLILRNLILVLHRFLVLVLG